MNANKPFSFRPVISRFSDCGHTESGEFDHGNTCASGGSHSEKSASSDSKSAKKKKRSINHFYSFSAGDKVKISWGGWKGEKIGTIPRAQADYGGELITVRVRNSEGKEEDVDFEARKLEPVSD